MRILVPVITIVLGLSIVSTTSAAKMPSNRIARVRQAAISPMDTEPHLRPDRRQQYHSQQQRQEVHMNSIALSRRRLSINSGRNQMLQKRAPQAGPPGGSGGTVVGGILGGSGKPVVLDTSPDPTDTPQSKPNPNELFVGPVLEKKLLDVNTPGASAPARGPAPPVVKLNTEHHKIVETTIPNMKQGPLGTGNQTPPPTP